MDKYSRVVYGGSWLETPPEHLLSCQKFWSSSQMLVYIVTGVQWTDSSMDKYSRLVYGGSWLETPPEHLLSCQKFHSFPHSLQATARIRPRLGYDFSFQILSNPSLIYLPTIRRCIVSMLKASFNNPQRRDVQLVVFCSVLPELRWVISFFQVSVSPL
jgi:hypothetical protein